MEVSAKTLANLIKRNSIQDRLQELRKEGFLPVIGNFSETHRDFTVNWELTEKCNYDCSYCWNHSREGNNYSDEDISRLIKSIRKCTKAIRVEVSLSGGEPTYYPKFDLICDTFLDNNCELIVVSNGSRSLNWWRERMDKFEVVVLSYHSEQTNHEHYKKVVELIGKKSRARVVCSVMMLRDNFDKMVQVAEELSDMHCCEVEMRPVYGTQYTDEQMNQILNCQKTPNSKVVDSIKTSMGNNPWLGKKCYVGVDGIVIDHHGTIHTSWCSSKEEIGSIYSEDILERLVDTKPIRCKSLNVCQCSTDQKARKQEWDQ